MISALKIFGTGQITLPKEWRDKVQTMYFIAEETPRGLLLKPLTEAVYYETEEGGFGLNFPMGIEAGKLAAEFKKAEKRLKKSKKNK